MEKQIREIIAQNVGGTYEAKQKCAEEILRLFSVIVPKGRLVCGHPKPYKNTPWGYKVCKKCNDIVEREQTNAL